MRRIALCFGPVVLAGLAIAQTQQPPESNIPTEPGMYAATPRGPTKILGQIVTFTRTGSRLASELTIGIKAAHDNVQLPGPHAQTVIVDSKPVFYFIPTKQQADLGLDAGDVVLIRLEEKKERRQFEVRAWGMWRGSSGISVGHQIQLLRSEEKARVYKIEPATALRRGEYALYLRREEAMSATVYDFSVPAGSK